MHSLAFGHCDIPARVIDIEDNATQVVISGEEARAHGFVPFRRWTGDDTHSFNPGPPHCPIWRQRSERRLMDAREYVLDMLGFENDEPEVRGEG